MSLEPKGSATVEDAHGSGGTASYGRIKPIGVDTTHGAILYLESISVVFDGFRALNDLSLDIGVGELRCIIGPNGAGKTTMMDVITGQTRPTSGHRIRKSRTRHENKQAGAYDLIYSLKQCTTRQDCSHSGLIATD